MNPISEYELHHNLLVLNVAYYSDVNRPDTKVIYGPRGCLINDIISLVYLRVPAIRQGYIVIHLFYNHFV